MRDVVPVFRRDLCVYDIRNQKAAGRGPEKLNNVQGQISGLQGMQGEVGEEIEEIDAELVQIIASVDLIKEEIVEKEEQIKVTEAEYEAAKAREEEQYEAMKVRIKFMYEQGDISYVQLFMTSDSFGDMLNKADYVEQIYAYDRKMLEEYQAAKEYVQQVWDKLEEENRNWRLHSTNWRKNRPIWRRYWKKRNRSTKTITCR